MEERKNDLMMKQIELERYQRINRDRFENIIRLESVRNIHDMMEDVLTGITSPIPSSGVQQHNTSVKIGAYHSNFIPLIKLYINDSVGSVNPGECVDVDVTLESSNSGFTRTVIMITAKDQYASSYIDEMVSKIHCMPEIVFALKHNKLAMTLEEFLLLNFGYDEVGIATLIKYLISCKYIM